MSKHIGANWGRSSSPRRILAETASQRIKSELLPCRFINSSLGVPRSVADVEERETDVRAVVGADVQPARSLFSGLKSVDVVAERRKRVEPAWRDDFVVCFADLEALFRGEVGGVAGDLEIADARFAFEAQGTNAHVRMAVRRQERAGFQPPLDNEKRLAEEASAEMHGRIERSKAAQFGSRRLFQP